MAGVYFYVPRNKLEDIVDCGLKLSEWYDREISLPGLQNNKKVIKALLNPKDDEERLKDPAYQCLRLEVDLENCKVGDSDLYQTGLREPALMEYYKSSLIPLKDYCFGIFRSPEVLVVSSILPERIEVMGKTLDIPILFENSAALYLNNILEKHEEAWNDSGNHLLYTYFLYLESQGKAVRFENREKNKTIFFYKDSREYIVLQQPEGELPLAGSSLSKTGRFE